jgi:UDP-3-O-[3-hydroxymyristoyl] glucosamine N-acyltransferase
MEDPAAGRRENVLMAKAAEIAEWVGAASADSVSELTGVSSIETAGPASVVFATDVKTLARALESRAGMILASSKLEASGDARAVSVADARYAFAVVARGFEDAGGETKFHSSAVVDPTAIIGRGTRIGAGVVIGQKVTIGEACEIGPQVTIYANVTLGDRVHVQAGAVLGSKGFGYVRNVETAEYILFPQQGTLVVEDDVDIGANTTIDRGALGETRIGRGTKIDNLVHIGHNCVVGRNVIIAAQTGISGSSVIEEGAILGGQVGIGEHALVGEGVILGGGAGVLSGKKMHGKGEVFWGRPARPLKQYLKDLAKLKKG